MHSACSILVWTMKWMYAGTHMPMAAMGMAYRPCCLRAVGYSLYHLNYIHDRMFSCAGAVPGPSCVYIYISEGCTECHVISTERCLSFCPQSMCSLQGVQQGPATAKEAVIRSAVAALSYYLSQTSEVGSGICAGCR